MMKEPVYDVEEAVKFIERATCLSEEIITIVLDAEQEYMERIGIVEEA